MQQELKSIRDTGTLFRGVPDAELASLAAEATPLTLSGGETLFDTGDPADRLFLVLSGRVALVRTAVGSPPVTEPRQAGDLLAEVEFSTRAPYTREAKAVGDTRLLCLTHASMDRLLASAPAVWSSLHTAILERTRWENLALHLDRLFGPFGILLPHVVKDLESGIEWVTLSRGETLVKQGEAADSAYILMTGRLHVALEHEPGEEKVVNTISAGEIVGELALLTEHTRSSTVYAIRDSELARISPRTFRLMLERSSKAAMRVAQILAGRLASASSERDLSRAPVSTIALIPANGAVTARQLAEDLAKLLSAEGEVALLTRESVDSLMGTPGISVATGPDPGAVRLVQWLHEEEGRRRYLIYLADAAWSPWSDRCVHQADRVVVVADGDRPPDLGETAARLSRPRQRWSLLLLHHPEKARPSGTANWLRGSSCDQAYHVRRGSTPDLARLARLLTGRALGLVFGGGGARGFAHLGVLRALEELGIPVDMVGGTSIGALLAHLPAMGHGAAKALEVCEKNFRSLLDYTLPLASLVAGRRISNGIVANAGDWDIEDLWLPYFCVSTNLTTSEAMIHRRGNLARAERASIAIPGVLPPVPHEGSLLIDGCVLNNIPIDVMRDLNPFGTVIGVDVGSPTGPKAKSDYGLSLSGWSLAARRLNPWKKAPDVPALSATIMFATMVGSAHTRDQALKNNLADLYLPIHVRGVGLLEFDAVAKVANLGYSESVERLRKWFDEERRAKVR